MAVLIVASSEPRAGRSLIAAALAHRLAREGRSLTLARLSGGDSAAHDAATFASLEGIVAPETPVEPAALRSIPGDLVVEAPAGPVTSLAADLNARVVVVAASASPTLDVADVSLVGSVLTRVPAGEVESARNRPGVIAVLPEDAILAAPSVGDIAERLAAKWLSEPADPVAVEQVMIGTVASDAAGPYFDNRRRTCVVTRFDKTDIQLAALNTDVQCMVLTGGGEPSPYLLDRIAGHRPDVALLLTNGTTVEAVHEIEPLFGLSRFDGEGKLMRAVELLDAARVEVAV